MQDRPDKLELLRGVEYFLADEAIPQLEGPAQFHARVAANAVRMVIRELQSEEEDLRSEYRGLCEIFRIDEPAPAALEALRRRVTELNERLSTELREGSIERDSMQAQILSHLRGVTIRKVAVTNPAMAELLKQELSDSR